MSPYFSIVTGSRYSVYLFTLEPPFSPADASGGGKEVKRERGALMRESGVREIGVMGNDVFSLTW